MSNKEKRLVKAFINRDRIESYLANLEKLKSEKEIDDEQYLITRKDYYRRLGVATSEIARIKNEIKDQLADGEHSLELARKKLSSLDIKHKVGELSDVQYQAAEREARKEIQGLEKDVEQLNNLIGATSAADIPVIPKRSAPRAPKPAPVARETPQTRVPIPVERITPTRRGGLSRSKLIGIISVAAVVVIAVVAGVIFLMGDREEPALWGMETATFNIPINITGAPGIGSLQFELVYDPMQVSAVEVISGNLPDNALFEYRIDAPGRVIVGLVYAKGISGDGSVALVTFQPRDDINGSVPLQLENIIAYDASTMSQIAATASAGSYSKDGASVPPVLIFSATGE